MTLHTSSYAGESRPGWLDMSPGNRAIRIDRVVSEPRLVGRRVPGIPLDHDTFIPTDAHGRVPGLENVFAAGDATSFPIKQGGLAAQQADAVAEAIAALVGIDIEPRPFHPVLRGVLLTGGSPRYLRADISGTAGDDSVISRDALWWPPDKLAGRFLAPYISGQTGSALDVRMVPFPSSPRFPNPQQYARPAVEIPQFVKAFGADVTLAKLIPPLIGPGVRRSLPIVPPACPLSLWPQHSTLPPFSPQM